MKRTLSYTFMLAGLVMSLAAANSSTFTAMAQTTIAPFRADFPRPFTCTQGTLNGTYGMLIKGNILNLPGLPMKQYAAIGLVTFDGHGNFYTHKGLVNNNGALTPLPDETGTYTLDSDCKGTMIGQGGNYQIVVSKNGHEYDAVYSPQTGPFTPTPLVLSGIGKKVEPYEVGPNPLDRARSFYCSMGTIAGTWSVSFEGMTNDFPPLPPGPFRGVVTLKYDSSGAFTGSNKAVFGGFYIESPQTGQQLYVNSDCTTAGSGDVSGYGVLVNGGKELLLIGTYPAGINFENGKGIITTSIGQKVR